MLIFQNRALIAEGEAGLRLLSDLPNVDHLFKWPCRCPEGLRDLCYLQIIAAPVTFPVTSGSALAAGAANNARPARPAA
jgi:hypothetical protein